MQAQLITELRASLKEQQVLNYRLTNANKTMKQTEVHFPEQPQIKKTDAQPRESTQLDELILDIHARLDELAKLNRTSDCQQLRQQVTNLEISLLKQQMEQRMATDRCGEVTEKLEAAEVELKYFKGLSKELKRELATSETETAKQKARAD